MDNIQTAKIIKQLCKTKRISIKTAFEECGVRPGLIHDLERRNKTPSPEILEKIADYFDCSIDYLVGRTENPEITR